MKRLIACFVAALVLTLALTPRADAEIGQFNITNHTSRSAWITIYASSNVPWRIVTAFCLKGGQSAERNFQNGGTGIYEMKIRAEVKYRSDCGGPNLSDTYDVRKSSGGPVPASAAVREHGNTEQYYIHFL